MEEGKTYKIWYKDDKQTRYKDLKFLGSKHGLLIFFNKVSGKKEEIPVSSIIRIEGAVKDEKG